ncbi:TIR domain-containing protein [Alloacidobacterium dinghuense]|uniref:TIR domain-containing protein n=1 Tax=Alloacidobacterium dinghuense TaxID=2763107 RepID=A0A7G8BEM3_9BACT|nr:TIR domain-containing protein [Alloacidobacterium dinghuense]QNI30993.1 TIR domain-containing protein [Alloacidobacterium dinghuense]
MIYLIAPSVTKCNAEGASLICTTCEQALRRYVPTSPLDNDAAVRLVTAGANDTAIFFNPTTEVNLSNAAIKLLRSVGHAFPIAMTVSSRRPPDVANMRQSFDVTEYLALRGGERNIDLAGAAFAREVLSMIQPSLMRSRLSLFLSHRRADGESLARAFWEKLLVLSQNSFRDLADILIGESAQEVLESRLRQSDAVLFFDTRLAYTSEWVERELRIALRNGIPIVWIKVGTHGLPNSFPHPAATPHLFIQDGAVTSDEAEQAVSAAADLVRESAVQILDADARLKEVENIDVEIRDPNKLINAVRIVCGKGMPYPLECTTHLVQFFGTHPRPDDVRGLADFPGKYTARLLLLRGPIPDTLKSQTGPIAARAEDYVDCLEDYMSPQHKASKQRGVIISGAFPDGCTPKDQQDIIDAVRAFAQRILQRGGTIMFGAHPTFVPLIVASARQLRSNDVENALHLYYSKEFVSDLAQYNNHGTVIGVPKAGGRNASLTLMRERMVADEFAVGLVAIGGRLVRPGIVPGVDEEMALARKRNLPVLLIGSVQGRASEIAAEFAVNNWENAPNSFTREENERLRTSGDFAGLASTFLRRLGI